MTNNDPLLDQYNDLERDRISNETRRIELKHKRWVGVGRWFSARFKVLTILAAIGTAGWFGYLKYLDFIVRVNAQNAEEQILADRKKADQKIEIATAAAKTTREVRTLMQEKDRLRLEEEARKIEVAAHEDAILKKCIASFDARICNHMNVEVNYNGCLSGTMEISECSFLQSRSAKKYRAYTTALAHCRAIASQIAVQTQSGENALTQADCDVFADLGN